MKYNEELGDLTQLAIEKIWGINEIDENEDTEICDYIKNPENFSNFRDGLVKLIKEIKPEIKTDKEILDYIKNSAKEKKIEYDNSFITTIRNWISGKINPQANEGSKSNLYKLCFILGLNATQVITFFQKVCLMRPFSCRNLDETIYLFCFVNNKSYNDFIRIKDIISFSDEENKKDIDLNTSEFITKIEKIADEKKLIKFIESNAFFFNGMKASAINRCKNLLAEVKEKTLAKSNKEIMENILGRGRTRKPIPKSDFLKIVKRDFPNELTLSKLNRGKPIMEDEIRKTIILLQFYLYCKTYDGSNMYDDFISETDHILEDECGYPPLYSRNPYDCMFIHSVIVAVESGEALEEFQSIVSVMLHEEI